MKKLLLMILFLSVASSAQAETYAVESVIDGSTLRLANGEEARLIGVDTSKIGYEALENVRKWVEGKEVRLEFDAVKRDEQGRLWAYVYKEIEVEVDLNRVGKDFKRVVFPSENEGRYEFFLNAVVISNGYARYFDSMPDQEHAGLLKELYEEAKKEKRGFWKDGHLRNIAECAKAGGMLKNIKECDNSDSDWCIISETEQCYGQQVRNGRCTAGEYSEEYDSIVGITPRVLCDQETETSDVSE